MNPTLSKLYTILLSLGTFLLIWTNPFGSGILSQIVSAPSLEQQPKLLTSELTNIPPEVKSAVLDDTVKRTSKTVSALEIIEAKQQEWPNGCLGLATAEEICTQAITPGWQIVVTDGLRNWTYRTDNIGNAVRLEKREEL